MATMADTL